MVVMLLRGGRWVRTRQNHSSVVSMSGLKFVLDIQVEMFIRQLDKRN